MAWLDSKHQESRMLYEKRESRENYAKNGEETLAVKAPYLIMRGLEPIIDKQLLGHFGMFTQPMNKSY